jgi:hypothetical protein
MGAGARFLTCRVQRSQATERHPGDVTNMHQPTSFEAQRHARAPVHSMQWRQPQTLQQTATTTHHPPPTTHHPPPTTHHPPPTTRHTVPPHTEAHALSLRAAANRPDQIKAFFEQGALLLRIAAARVQAGAEASACHNPRPRARLPHPALHPRLLASSVHNLTDSKAAKNTHLALLIGRLNRQGEVRTPTGQQGTVGVSAHNTRQDTNARCTRCHPRQ